MTSPPLPDWLEPERRLLVAFSGGLDSTVLLYRLVQLRERHPALQLRAVHIHHGISRFADAWVEHCQEICDSWNVPLQVRRVTLENRGQGPEAQAREARYRALASALAPDEALVTAQHLDDQCETLLLALRRGSGPAGLAAMPQRLAFAHTVLLRPLLDTPRSELEAWARQHRLCWIDDDSNADDSFDRNFLRLHVLPLLQARWPHFARAAARSAALCGEQEQLLDELLSDALSGLLGADNTLRIAPLAEMSEARRNALLRRWFAHLKVAMPSRAALTRLWEEVACAREDAAPQLRFGAYAVRRYRGALWWVKTRMSLDGVCLKWRDSRQPLVLPEGLGMLCWGDSGIAVRPPRADEPVSVRFGAHGQIHIVGRERGRTIKKLWQELGIPPWQRAATPLLFYGEQPVAAPGVFITQEGQAQPGQSWLLDWKKEQEQ
ncbi:MULTISPECIES: tRNA lysidine(34) synthetase TilS [Tenebrionibacter/Tenebrionicola group]|jgi:tRNA(Ile)-lysidine synthase|uniref:tRNA(Ile)-lysidine synthase n=2 Tax=Tenebrionibacter/Tenebrionicola group TaxID=2969848 RepID=A0A8K0V4K2_9ENTR|nr:MULTISPECIES: tRNA lysidine(34) synthetase TilS [Tenebrionibacter/Tenebrionicola group]MBK4714057.1 tRNA lysidine(34) synthetase TilS [Tenebrionibacter intestinalis]MBV5094452.1 tRNA lysidine(34) synthetase TilS [Tenebrionicola larvae]